MGELHGRYHHVSVCVSDLDRARAFYGGPLGLKEIARPAFKFPGVWYALDGDIALHIMVTEWPAPRPAPERFDLVHPHFALWTDDADQTFERLHAVRPQRARLHLDPHRAPSALRGRPGREPGGVHRPHQATAHRPHGGGPLMDYETPGCAYCPRTRFACVMG